MKHYRLIALLTLFSSIAFAAEPSTESIERLLAATEVEKMLLSTRQQLNAMMTAGIEQAFRGKVLAPEAKDYVAGFQKKLVDEMMDEMRWDKMKDLYLQVYRETFTQEEIDGLLAFYQSPAGKAFVTKMPALMQKTMSLMQQRIGPMMQKMERSIKETAADLEAKLKSNRQ